MTSQRIMAGGATSTDRGPRRATSWPLAFALAFAALASGLLLGGVSMWFLGAVALAGLTPAALTFNFHIPAALVRLFAVSRTAAKYGERVVGHKAALADQVARRAGLFSAMAAAPAVRRAGWQLGNQDRLADYLDDVEDVDYARLRVTLPLTAAIAGSSALALALLAVAPLALAPIGLAFLAILLASRRLRTRVLHDWDAIRSKRRTAARHLGATLAAVVPLQAEGDWRALLGRAFQSHEEAEDDLRSVRYRQAMLDAGAALIGPLGAAGILAAAWISGDHAESLLPAAFLAFAWLALGEVWQGVSRIVLASARETAAKESLSQWSDGNARQNEHERPGFPGQIAELAIADLGRSTPDGRRLGAPFDATFRRGVPAVLSGPSGCGKTSLLKQIAGWLGDDGKGAIAGDGVALDASARRAACLFCPHDAAVLSDTVRENLFAPGASDDELRSVLAAVELEARIDAAGWLDGWITQDMLSLGEAQRLNLARAMLSRLPVVLLDEPAEHLDVEQARRIMDRLIAHFHDRILVFSSHEGRASWPGRQMQVIALDAPRGPIRPIWPVG